MDKTNFQTISTQLLPYVKTNKPSLPIRGQSFKQQFQHSVNTTNDKLLVSKHAQIRMNQRNINIDSTTWSKIEAKLQQAKKMGVTESLVLTDQAALVVSAKNNMVITAMDRKEASAQIFTNINGTILID